MGEIHITVDTEKAPITAKNFTDYVEDGFFDGTIFHRVIPNFMIQGGGMTEDMQQKTTKENIFSFYYCNSNRGLEQSWRNF